MVAVALPYSAPRPTVPGELTLGGAGRALRRLAVAVSGLHAGGAVLAPAEGLEPTRAAWLEVTLPGGRVIRPLCELAGQEQDGEVPVRFKHLFPDQRRALESLAPEPR